MEQTPSEKTPDIIIDEALKPLTIEGETTGVSDNLVQVLQTSLDELSLAGEHELADEDEIDYLCDPSNSPWDVVLPDGLREEINKEYKIYTYGELTEVAKSDELNRPEHLSFGQFIWSKFWGEIKVDEVDPLQAAADFYILFGIMNNAFVKFQPLTLPTREALEEAGKILGIDQTNIDERLSHIQKLMDEDPRSRLTDMGKQAKEKFHALVEFLDPCFREYVHMACGGELRHHVAFKNILGGYRKGAWVYWKLIYDQYGPESLIKMEELFLEFGNSGFGGGPWANAAKILYQREMGLLGPDEFTNKQLFVDRVFSLEHNGGCFLNKIEWINKREHRGEDWDYHYSAMAHTVLTAHSAKVVNIDRLYGFASPEVQNFLKEYLSLATKFNMPILGVWKDKKPVQEIPEEIPTSEKPHSYGWKAVMVKPKEIDWDKYFEASDEPVTTFNCI